VELLEVFGVDDRHGFLLMLNPWDWAVPGLRQCFAYRISAVRDQHATHPCVPQFPPLIELGHVACFGSLTTLDTYFHQFGGGPSTIVPDRRTNALVGTAFCSSFRSAASRVGSLAVNVELNTDQDPPVITSIMSRGVEQMIPMDEDADDPAGELSYRPVTVDSFADKLRKFWNIPEGRLVVSYDKDVSEIAKIQFPKEKSVRRLRM